MSSAYTKNASISLSSLLALALLIFPVSLQAQVDRDRLEIALARAQQPSWSMSIDTSYGESTNFQSSDTGYRLNFRRLGSRSFTSFSLDLDNTKLPLGLDPVTGQRLSFRFGKDKVQENGWWRTHSANFSFEDGSQGASNWTTSRAGTSLTWTLTYDPFILSPYVSASVAERNNASSANRQYLYLALGGSAVFLANPQISAYAGISANGQQQLRPYVAGVDFSPWVSFGLSLTSVDRLYTTRLDYGYSPARNRYQISIRLRRKLTGLDQ